MKALLVIIALLVTACGKDQRVDYRLRPALDYYLSIAPNQGALDDLISLEFGTLPEGRNGYCDRGTQMVIGGRRVYRDLVITIREGAYNSYMKALVSHELAHCLHSKDHTHTNDKYALMNPEMTTRTAYWDEHLDEQLRGVFE